MLTGAIYHRILAPDPAEVTFARRGFHAGDTDAQQLLETIGDRFLVGLEYGMTSRDAAEAGRRLGQLSPDVRGFGYEGAAMGLALLDSLLPGRPRRLDAFIAGPARPHIYMAHVGAGWAMARLPHPLRRRIRLRDRLLSGLALDGYGFHEAYFRTESVVRRQELPTLVGSKADPGVGRALWFTCGADVDQIAETIGRFDLSRRADLWSGAGLAATYAGGADEKALIRLHGHADRYGPQLAQGAAFAAKARLRAGLATPYTSLAASALCGLSAEEAARVTDECLPRTRTKDAYEHWRHAIQERFAAMRPAG